MLPDAAASAAIGISTMSQCTCRCVVLPDPPPFWLAPAASASQCTCRCVVLPDFVVAVISSALGLVSQCTCRCVVLPDVTTIIVLLLLATVSMHLQVRGAP